MRELCPHVVQTAFPHDCRRRSHGTQFAHIFGLERSVTLLLGLGFVLLGLCANAYAQATTTASEPVPALLDPLPSPEERLLSPVPVPFGWMDREVSPDPLLEALVLLREAPFRLLMSVTLAEEYSDNFSFRTQQARGEDYRTSLSIGTVYRMESGPSFVSLANTIGANYAVRSEESNFDFANLSLNAGHQFPRLALVLSESLVRSDEISQASSSGIRRGRQNFLRNRVSPQMRYTLSRLTALDLAYANTVVFNDASDQDNSITHSVTTGLQHQFSRVLTGAITYGFTAGNGQGGAADTEAHSVSATLGYALERHTRVTLQAFSRLTNRSNGGTDSQIYGGSVGIRRQLTSFLSAFASLGPTLLDRQGQGQRAYVNWQAAVDGALPISRRASLTLATQQNISDTQGEVNSVGIVLSQSVSLRLNYLVSRSLLTSLFAAYARTELLEDPVGTSESVRNREDNFWQAGASASYALTRALHLSASYLYRRRESNLASANFDENRVTLTLSSSFQVF